MAKVSKTVEYILEQISKAGAVRARQMFGGYTIYCDNKVVALVCDDQLFVKPTKSGNKFIGNVCEAPPYPGAKNYYLIAGEQWDDADWLTDLIRRSAAELPMPKPKKQT